MVRRDKKGLIDTLGEGKEGKLRRRGVREGERK